MAKWKVVVTDRERELSEMAMESVLKGFNRAGILIAEDDIKSTNRSPISLAARAAVSYIMLRSMCIRLAAVGYAVKRNHATSISAARSLAGTLRIVPGVMLGVQYAYEELGVPLPEELYVEPKEVKENKTNDIEEITVNDEGGKSVVIRTPKERRLSEIEKWRKRPGISV